MVLRRGRDARVREKLESVVDDIEAAFETLGGDSTSLSKTERTTRAIANRLGNAFNEEDLAAAIDAETSGSDYYHTEYSSRVIEFKGVKRMQYEDEPDIFLLPEQWWRRKAVLLIEALDGDPIDDTAPAFTEQEFLRAASQVDLTQSDDSTELQKYLDHVLERLNFHWNKRSEQFEPRSDADDEASTGGNSTSASPVD